MVATVVGCVLISLGGFLAAMNWGCILAWLRRHQHHSMIPVIGGAFLTAGLALIPIPMANRWAWFGLLIDFGCVPLLIWTAVFLIVRSWRK